MYILNVYSQCIFNVYFLLFTYNYPVKKENCIKYLIRINKIDISKICEIQNTIAK